MTGSDGPTQLLNIAARLKHCFRPVNGCGVNGCGVNGCGVNGCGAAVYDGNGCGGTVAATWLQRQRLPQPGRIGPVAAPRTVRQVPPGRWPPGQTQTSPDTDFARPQLRKSHTSQDPNFPRQGTRR